MNRFFQAMFILVIPIFTTAQDIHLKFDPLSPTKATSVGFIVSEGDFASPHDLVDKPLRVEETQEHKYRLFVDTQSFKIDKWHRFAFNAYVQPARANANTRIMQYTVSEDPTGAFRDDISLVTFHISGHDGEDVATIKLPVHSDDGDNTTLAIPSTPRKIGISGTSTLELGLKNNLDALHVTINATEVSSTMCPNCWLVMSAKPSLGVLAPGRPTSLLVSLRPNTVPAFVGTIFTLNPDTAHDFLLITVSTTADQGGILTPQEFKIPIRFFPSPWHLLIAVILGAVIGCLLRFGLTDQPASHPLKTYGTLLLISFVTWIFALVLFSYTETRVTVFGFSFDPSQVLPAGLIALLAGGGPAIVGKLKEMFGK